jgi:ABC-type transport system involved in multi-copper enzyme maturation permease subunit
MSRVLLLARKDAQTIARSWALLLILVIYPVLIALLVGQLLLDATANTSIAFVNEDTTGKALKVGDESFGLDRYREQAEDAGVRVVDMHRKEAMRALREGQVNGVLVIPDGFFARLSTLLAPADIEFHSAPDQLGSVVRQRVRGSVYNLNLDISRTFVETNAEYLKTLVEGGGVEVGGDTYNVMGLEPAVTELQRIRNQVKSDDALSTIDGVIDFAQDAQVAIGLADKALDATAAPIRIHEVRQHGTSPKLTARALSIGLAVSLTFLCIVLIAGSLAGERDERALTRLLAGIASPAQVIGSKLVLGVGLATIVGTALFVAVGLMSDQPWSRLPLLMVALAVAAVAFSALGTLIGTLARDARTATLIAMFVALPTIALGLLPASESVHLISAPLPFGHAQELFNAVLFERDPWPDALRQSLALIAIALPAALLSRRFVRRLV